MRTPTEREDVQKEEVLQKCFESIVETGIEGASIKEFSNATGMSSSSLYYWFKDKDEIVIDSTYYGIKEIVNLLFDETMKNVNSVNKLTNVVVNLVKANEAKIKAILQIATSPLYGEKIVELTNGFAGIYNICTLKISEQSKRSHEEICEIVDLYFSVIIDCVIWNKWDQLEKKTNAILMQL